MRKAIKTASDFILGPREFQPLDRLYCDEGGFRDAVRDFNRTSLAQERIANRYRRYHRIRRAREVTDQLVAGSVIVLLGVAAVIVSSTPAGEESSSSAPSMPSEASESLRTRAMHDSSVLSSLGVCALELKAQLNLDRQATQYVGYNAILAQRVEDDKTALKAAERDSMSCYSSRKSVEIESKVSDDRQSVAPDLITTYNLPTWCRDRVRIVQDPSQNAFAKLAFLAAGDKTFGTYGADCNIYDVTN